LRSEDLVTVAAWLYYKEGLKQEEVAHRLGVSRVMVTRLLARARREGVVQFVITRPLPEPFRLAQELRARYGLEDAAVAPDWDTLGAAAADYLLRVLAPGDRLGLGWSTTVSRLAPFLHPPRKPLGGVVAELVGHFLGQKNPYSVSARVAEVLGMRLSPLPAPVLFASPAARAAILTEPRIREGLATARKSRVALVGVGLLSPSGTLVQTGMLTPKEATELRRLGAVGDVLMRFFDAFGRPLATPLDARVLAISWDDFLSIPHRVAVAGGEAKVPALRAALSGGLFSALITDVATARTLLVEASTAG